MRNVWRSHVRPVVLWLPVAVVLAEGIAYLTGDRWDAGYWTAVLFFNLLPSRRVGKEPARG